jgi:hypothetical protein
LGLAAVLAAGCSAGSVSSGASTSGAAGTAAPAGTADAPALTAAQARQVFDAFVAVAAKATTPKSASPLLPLVTGTELAALNATLSSHSVTDAGTASTAAGAYGSSLTVEPGIARYAYGSPTFYLPEAGGYPRFFVASVSRTLQGMAGAATETAEVGDARVPVDGSALMLFSQASGGAPWLLASVSQLPAGVTIPALAADQSGYIPTVPLADASLLAAPGDTGPLQAAVVDDGPQSADTRVIADGPLTTGMYQGAVSHADYTTTPRGDVYQWDLEGVNDPEFALRTADGGALVFYAMTLNTTVAVPDVINKANPIHPGPKIPVPLAMQMLLPQHQPAPQQQLQAQQTLSFAAVDPPQGTTKIQVIAIGGGLTSASAS